jgi:hypothetical protein
VSKLRPILGYETNVRFRCWNAVPLYPILPESKFEFERSVTCRLMFITFLVGLAPERNMNSQFTATGSKVATVQRFIVIKLIHDKLFLQQQTKTLAHSAILSVKMEKYRCPYTGCSSAFGTVSGVRKHWQSKHPGEVPTLIAADLLVEQNSLEQREMVSDHSDNDLIVMMGLTNNECAIDSRSAGRFARCSELEFQAPVAVTITVSEPNPWKLATGAFFAAIFQEIQSCEVSTKLALSESGKIFRAVHAANENYR